MTDEKNGAPPASADGGDGPAKAGKTDGDARKAPRPRKAAKRTVKKTAKATVKKTRKTAKKAKPAEDREGPKAAEKAPRAAPRRRRKPVAKKEPVSPVVVEKVDIRAEIEAEVGHAFGQGILDPAPAAAPAEKAPPKRRRRRSRKRKPAEAPAEATAASSDSAPAAAEAPKSDSSGEGEAAPAEGDRPSRPRRRRRRSRKKKPAEGAADAAAPAQAPVGTDEAPPAPPGPPAESEAAPGEEAPKGAPRRRRRRRRRSSGSAASTRKIMLMNAVDPGEVRVAVLEDGQLGQMYLERSKQHLIAGNIYLAKVVSVRTELQAAFVDLGVGKNGFLHVSDVFPPSEDDDITPKKSRKWISKVGDVLRKGQEVLVQVTKEGISQKGPAVTMNLSVPGRFLVLMPGLKRLGVSKKIEDQKARDELKKMLKKLDPPKDLGFIVRTAGMGRSIDELEGDLEYLIGLWEELKRRAEGAKAPALIYQESDLVIRSIRDTFTEDTARVIVDSEDVHKLVRDFVKSVIPAQLSKVEFYDEEAPLFHEFEVEEQLNRLLGRKVDLPSGGSLIIEQTEALVAIDVNSGKTRRVKSNRQMILNVNLEAVKEVARQLSLRDIGGLVMIDLIDMDDLGDRAEVENALKEALATDKARVRMAPISDFGILEMTRQRVREGLARSLFEACPSCGGTGMVKTPESVGLECLRSVKAAIGGGAGRVEVTFNPEVALYVANRYRNNMIELETNNRAEIVLKGDASLEAGEMKVRTLDTNQGE